MKPEIIENFERTIPVSNDYIPLNPLCDLFRISYRRQTENLRSHPGFTDHFNSKAFPEFFGDQKKRICLSKKGFMKWVLQLNYKMIEEDLQMDFIQYQDNVMNYLFDSVFQREQILSQKALDELEAKRLERDLKARDPEFQKYLDLRMKIARSGKSLKDIDDTFYGKQLTFFSEDQMKG